MDDVLRAFATEPLATHWGVAILRLLSACVLGGMIGFEREWHRKPAGLRTHILVSVGACLFCLLTFELMLAAQAEGSSATRTDPIRLIEAVTAGVAFLAAGTILRSDGHVTGLTTGAELWVAGAVGLACGLGQIALAAFVTVLVLIVLVVVRRLERRFPKKEPPD